MNQWISKQDFVQNCICFFFVLYLFFQYCICVRLILNSNSWLRNVNCLPKSTVVNLERRAGVKEVSWRFDALKHNLIIDLNLWNNYTEPYFHSIRNFDQQSFSFALADACRIYLAWHTTSPSDFTLYCGRILNCAFLALNSLSITLKKPIYYLANSSIDYRGVAKIFKFVRQFNNFTTNNFT